jgi:hypothetical protein
LIICTLARRGCALLIRIKNKSEENINRAKKRSIDQINSQLNEITKATGEEIDPEYLYAELDDEYFTVADPHKLAPLPLIPTKWQQDSSGPSLEVNLLLVAQMGLLNSCFSVFSLGAAMRHEISALAVVVLLLIFVGDAAFFRFLKGTIRRLKSDGSLEYVPTDDVFDISRSVHPRGTKQLFQHDDDGHVRRDNLGRKIPAKMDAHAHPAIACETIVHADQHHVAIYYEHDCEGNPLKVDNGVRPRPYLVPAVSDYEGYFSPSAKPVPVNLEQPEKQNAKEVAYYDEFFRDRLYLLVMYGGKTHGVWQGNTEEASTFLGGYGSAFAKFGAFGFLYYFVELGRKMIDCAVIAFARGSAQTGAGAVLHWLFAIVFTFMMPYADAKSNSNEITQNMGRLATMVLCAAMNLGLIPSETTAAIISK